MCSVLYPGVEKICKTTSISENPVRRRLLALGIQDMNEAVAWVKRCPHPMPGPLDRSG
jgi:hypothetical protein